MTTLTEKQKRKIQSILIHQCSNNFKPPKIYGLDSEEYYLNQILETILIKRQSHSALLIGPHGSGKTLLFNSVLSKYKNYKFLPLNGLLHSDPRSATQHLIKTLTDSNTPIIAGSFEEEAELLTKQMIQQKHSMIIYLENFDLFALHQRSSQSFLYFIFDLLHHTDISFGIIGETNRLDCISLLEKRVVSRFSQLQIPFYPPSSFELLFEIIRDRLVININDPRLVKSKYLSCYKQYNQNIAELLDDLSLISILERLYSISREVTPFLLLFRSVISEMEKEYPYIKEENFFKEYSRVWIDTQRKMIESLSTLELCLVVSMMCFEVNQTNPIYNFERTFENYLHFISRSPQSFNTTKSVALKAFETLLEMEIISTSKKVDSKVPVEYRVVRLMIDPSLVQDIVKNSDNVITHLKNWAVHLNMHE